MTAIQGLIWCVYEIAIIIFGYPNATFAKSVHLRQSDYQVYQKRYRPPYYKKPKVKTKTTSQIREPKGRFG